MLCVSSIRAPFMYWPCSTRQNKGRKGTLACHINLGELSFGDTERRDRHKGPLSSWRSWVWPSWPQVGDDAINSTISALTVYLIRPKKGLFRIPRPTLDFFLHFQIKTNMNKEKMRTNCLWIFGKNATVNTIRCTWALTLSFYVF